ncbi:solute carrier family 52, riboflavin transporter, member 3-A-like [Copidosoma floridanum]|uniref:solute carrier family 52, riboflavin transporter, member 3-A-like n=1 Tax=Copidosoma floridanum TaxID=29053 RepID=UPI0006C9D263|nr:solute carrier family 52, riboflavin transporter, member 3-A-like [Copidosoma floridanum]
MDTAPEKSEKCTVRTVIVHILVMTFGASCWIGVNSIFIQLPLLINFLPEGWGLAAHLTIAVQAANIAPIIYSLVHKFLVQINESKCIFLMLVIGCCVMGMMSFFYDKTFNIAGNDHSVALFLLTFFVSTISCTSSVLFMPHLKNFKEIYLVSYFVGEGIGGVLPSIVALIQGVGEFSGCSNSTDTNNVLDIHSPRFSTQCYFLFIFACLLLSLLAFLLLENLSFVEKEKIPSQSLDNNSNIDNNEQGLSCQKYLLMSSNGLTTECQVLERHVCLDDNHKTDVKKFSKTYYSQTSSHKNVESLYLYILLGIICLLANGLLPGFQPYSCLSYGNMTYHLSATLSQIVNPIACFLALWFLPHSGKLINLFSIVIFTVSGYVTYLALSSPNPPFQGTVMGKTLVVLSWTLLVGLIAYTKLIITSVFRRKSEKELFHVGIVMQAGSACGAVMSFVIINFTKLLQEYEQCSS